MLKPIIDFGSMVIIPFLGVIGVLGALKVRVSGYLAVLLVVWGILGLILIAGGITPMNKYDIVRPDEQKAWLASEFVGVVRRLWIFGLGFGLPLLLISWLHENRSISPIVRVVDGLISVGAFLFTSGKFICLYFSL